MKNPCIKCPLSDHDCHESGFADRHCEAWRTWKTELLIFKANERLRIQKLHQKILTPGRPQTAWPCASTQKE